MPRALGPRPRLGKDEGRAKDSPIHAAIMRDGLEAGQRFRFSTRPPPGDHAGSVRQHPHPRHNSGVSADAASVTGLTRLPATDRTS
jgi:hypothetical protein